MLASKVIYGVKKKISQPNSVVYFYVFGVALCGALSLVIAVTPNVGIFIDYSGSIQPVKSLHYVYSVATRLLSGTRLLSVV